MKADADARMKAISAALGIGDETPDPAKLAESLKTQQAENRQLRTEGKVRSLASKVSADAEALLDSRSFVTAIAALDPLAADFEAAVSLAMSDALSANPKFKIAAPGALRGGAEITGGNNGAKTFSRAQLRDTAFYQANEADITAAMKDGRITQ